MIGAYSPFQIGLSNKVIRLRNSKGLTYKAIAEFLIAEGYCSPRGFDCVVQTITDGGHYAAHAPLNFTAARSNLALPTNL